MLTITLPYIWSKLKSRVQEIFTNTKIDTQHDIIIKIIHLTETI